MRAEQASEVNEPNQVDDGAPLDLRDRLDVPLGHRLAAARERQGWSHADVGARLKLPARLIARLEADDYEGLTQGVYLHGYLGSYARLVGIPVEQAARVAAANTEAAPLVATGTISRSRYLFDRYSVSATYLILTAIIVVPAVWLATHGGLEQNLARTTPLDPPVQMVAATPAPESPVADPVDSSAGSLDMPADAGIAQATPPAPAATPETTPVIASMAPFPSTPPPTPATPGAATSIGSGAHVLSLKLAQQSWVEVIGADGRKLEYGMLGAGSERSYRTDGPLSVRLGNAQGAQLATDGAALDLAPFQRGNVAHVKLFGSSGPSDGRAE
jgi:cytoskeleton protein RodZ